MWIPANRPSRQYGSKRRNMYRADRKTIDVPGGVSKTCREFANGGIVPTFTPDPANRPAASLPAVGQCWPVHIRSPGCGTHEPCAPPAATSHARTS
jgi:hypothetical protein